jgi:tRNA G10  N-methylase Trm11
VPYRFETERRDYSDYASGRVFYGLPGFPALPIRLAGEMFARALALWAAQGLRSPCTVYDPCCGGAYHLATLAYLHWSDIGAIIGSDVDEEALREELLGSVEEHAIRCELFRADATDSQALQTELRGGPVDVVLTDVPYGRRSGSQLPPTAQGSTLAPAGRMLEALLSVITPSSIIAIAADKRQALAHPAYRRLGRMQLSDRHVVWLVAQQP